MVQAFRPSAARKFSSLLHPQKQGTGLGLAVVHKSCWPWLEIECLPTA